MLASRAAFRLALLFGRRVPMRSVTLRTPAEQELVLRQAEMFPSAANMRTRVTHLCWWGLFLQSGTARVS